MTWNDDVTKFKDLAGNEYNYGDRAARDAIDDRYTKGETDEIFRRKDDSYSNETIDELWNSRADKTQVYTKDETDDLLDGLENRTKATFAEVRATFVNFQNDTELHFQNIEDDIDSNYYTKTETNAIAEELDLTKQNNLVAGQGISLTEQSDGTYEITAQGAAIEDELISTTTLWSSRKIQDQIDDLNDELSTSFSETIDSLSTSESEYNSTQNDHLDSLTARADTIELEYVRSYRLFAREPVNNFSAGQTKLITLEIPAETFYNESLRGTILGYAVRTPGSQTNVSYSIATCTYSIGDGIRNNAFILKVWATNHGSEALSNMATRVELLIGYYKSV